MAEFLVEADINSINLNPDTVLNTTRHILEIEKTFGHTRKQGSLAWEITPSC